MTDHTSHLSISYSPPTVIEFSNTHAGSTCHLRKGVWQSFRPSENFAPDNSSGSHCHEEIDLHPKPKGDTMTLDETTRFRITNKFVGILGDEDAAKLMDAIPPIDWDRFATKDDIAAATILTKAEMELEFANFRTDMNNRFAEVQLSFAKVDVKFAEADAKMQKAFRAQTLTMVSFLFTVNALMVSLVTWLR